MNTHNPPRQLSPRTLSDEALLQKTQTLVRLERKVSVRLIEHLEEVDRRRLFLKRGFSSLYDYLIRGLGYSGGAAHRRIQAMEACRAVPELTAKLESGQVNLTQAMQVQGQLEREEKAGRAVSGEAKRELFAQVEGLSTRETKRVLAARTPELPPPDRERAISGEFTRLSFAADRELVEMLERIRDLGAHRLDDPGLLELFKFMARTTLAKLDPNERAKRARKARDAREAPTPAASAAADVSSAPAAGNAPMARPDHPSRGPSRQPVLRPTRRPDAATLHALHRRDGGRCRYVDPATGRRCDATRALQIEHKTPYAKGGPTRLENLELLCPGHNRLRAIEAYGADKMRRYLRT